MKSDKRKLLTVTLCIASIIVGSMVFRDARVDASDVIESITIEEEFNSTETGEVQSVSGGAIIEDVVNSVSGGSITIEDSTDLSLELPQVTIVTGGAINPEPIPDVYDEDTGKGYFYSDKEEARLAQIAFLEYKNRLYFQQDSKFGRMLSATSTHSHINDCYAGHRHTSECYETILNTATYRGVSGVQPISVFASGDSDGGDPRYRHVNHAYIMCGKCSNTMVYFYEEYYQYNNSELSLKILFSQEYIGANDSWLNINAAIPYMLYDYSGTVPDGTWRYGQNASGTNCYMKENPSYAYYKDLLLSIRSGSNSQEQLIKKLMKFGYIPDLACRNCYFGNTVTTTLKSVTYGQQYSFCSQIQDETPLCHNVVTSISPEISNQTVYINTPINKNILLNKLDGTSELSLGISDFVANTLGNNQSALISYTGLIGNARTNSTVTTTAIINVIPSLSSITVVPSESFIYNGTVPSFSVTANYLDGTTKILNRGDYTSIGWSEGYGIKNMTFTYTEGGKTVTSDVVINVLPNVTELILIPSSNSVLYASNPSFSGIATYEDGSSQNVSVNLIEAFIPTILGTQRLYGSYTENGITVNASCDITVLDYPINIEVNLENDYIYQSQTVSVNDSTITMASGEIINNVTITESDYDNESVGNVDIIYSYTLNEVQVSCTKTIEVKEDLIDINISSETVVMYNGQDIPITITAITNTTGTIVINKNDYTVIDFDNSVYDRSSKKYIVSYTYKNVTRTKEIEITILPNATSFEIITSAETVEGVFISFTATITYEDGLKKEISTIGNGLEVVNYVDDQVGYQTISFIYSEGDKSFKIDKTIRIRALINVSIPLNVLLEINPNMNTSKASEIIIDNKSKESVRVSIVSIGREDNSTMIDVEQSKFKEWNKLGIKDSNYIAIGFYYNDKWLREELEDVLYVANVTSEKQIGVIDKISKNSIKIVINNGTAFNSQKYLTYKINWSIKLAE